MMCQWSIDSLSLVQVYMFLFVYTEVIYVVYSFLVDENVIFYEQVM